MDRIDAMGAFVAAVDEGSLAGAARRTRRSPASVTRAISFLEDAVGVRLLHRTTRSLRLTDAGERYLASCRRILAEFDEASSLAAGERASPRGLLTITAPVVFGRLHVRPLVDAFLESHPAVQARLLLFDRIVGLVDEGIDVAARIGHLPDSGLIAVKVGEVRRVVCASPGYLAAHPPLRAPADLTRHRLISFSQVTGSDAWSFAAAPDGTGKITVAVRPRLTVNTAEAAIASACDGHGITSVLSYQIAEAVEAGRLVRLLRDLEPPPVPVHLVYPEARLAAAKVRAFVDHAVPQLRAALAALQDR